MRRQTFFTSAVAWAIALLTYNAVPIAGFSNPLDRIKKDFLALTRKSTSYHILLPKSSEATLLLKQKIRNRSKEEFVLDVFKGAAERYSLDKETAVRGGLLGELAPQGYCLAPELDEACFYAPLGEVYGPVESDYGYHLVLVAERTNCPKLDGTNTRLVRGGPEGKFSSQLAPPEGGYKSVNEEVSGVALQQLGFWLGTFIAGGIVAELAAKASGVIQTLPWE